MAATSNTGSTLIRNPSKIFDALENALGSLYGDQLEAHRNVFPSKGLDMALWNVLTYPKELSQAPGMFEKTKFGLYLMNTSSDLIFIFDSSDSSHQASQDLSGKSMSER